MPVQQEGETIIFLNINKLASTVSFFYGNTEYFD